MALLETVTIAGANIRVELYASETVAEWHAAIYINSEFWDVREFFNFADATEFMRDPLATDRAKWKNREKANALRENASIPYYAADYEKISYGKRKGPAPHC